MPEPLLKPAQVAKLLNVSLPFVYKLAANKQLPAIRFGADGSKKAVRFEYADIIKFIRRNKN